MKYRVYYTKTTQGQVIIEASSPTEAEQIFENEGGNSSTTEYDEPIEVYSVEMA